MFEQLKSILFQMGQGLLHQNLGEMASTVDKIAEIEKRSHDYRLSGGQSRVVLIADTDPLGPAFDFALDLARRTKCLIEVLYVRSADAEKSKLNAMLNKLGEFGCDFQMTFMTGNPVKAISDYGTQRQDVMAVVCSTSEALADKLKAMSGSNAPGAGTAGFPAVLFIGDSAPSWIPA